MPDSQPAAAREAVSANPDLFRVEKGDGERLVLLGGRCSGCGHHFFPRRAICPGCSRTDLDDVDLSPEGKVWTFTIAHQVPPGAIVEAPYVLGRVELPERVLVSALISDCSPEDARVGLDVEIVPVKVREDDEGRDVLAFAYRPVESAKEK